MNKKRIWYDDNASVAKFLLGGIGTGNVSVGSRGQLCDWEIFNTPMKDGKLPYTFFAIRTEDKDGGYKIRILESRLHPPYERSHGYDPTDNTGIPRFESARLAGEISRAYVELQDSEMPVDVSLDAFTPFIPLDAENSGIPAAIIRYKVKNRTDDKLKVSVAGSLANAVGFSGYSLFKSMKTDGELKNKQREDTKMKGVFYTNPALSDDHMTSGSMSFVTTSKDNVTIKPYWFKGGWIDCAHEFWHDFEQDGMLNIAPESKFTSALTHSNDGIRIGSICTDFILDAGEEKEVEFIISWYFPNRPARWVGHIICDPDNGRVVKNYYTKLFEDAWSVSQYVCKNMTKLEKATDDFRKAFYKTTLPPVMLDAMAANITVLRSNTCFRLDDGNFLGWEGCHDHLGCCEGNCHHVWNYQQTLAFLFPELERTMRRVNFTQETCDDG